MDIETFRNYCLGKTGVTEDFPFDESTLVFKVMNKIFALVDVDNFQFANLKCDPERALELREKYTCVKPGYHMNKKHWNSVYMDGTVANDLVLSWVDHSYDLIVKGLSQKDRQILASL